LSACAVVRPLYTSCFA